jgi:hypothetical protein
MKRHSKLALTILVTLMAALLLVFACSDKGSDPVLEDTSQCESLIAAANDSLGRQLDRMHNVTLHDPDSTLRPRDVDFTALYNLYSQISVQCPSELDAKFGIAFTGLMVFLQDEDLNDLIDRFKYVYDTLTFNPFPPLEVLPRLNDEGPMMVNGIPLNGTGILNVLPSLFKLDYAVLAAAANDPMVSEIQTLLEDQLLPKVIAARLQIDELLEDEDYTFIVTKEMQGNPGADYIEIDRSDFQLIKAALYAAEAGLHIFFSRDLDISEYTDIGATEAARQNSGFLDLKPNNVGLNHMQTAKEYLLLAADHMDTTLDYLIDEIGTDQWNDLIQVHPDDLQDLLDIKDSLAHYQSYFDGPKLLTVIFNHKSDTFSTIVDINKFFDDPLDNPKRFVPDYTVTIEGLPDQHIPFASQHFSRDRYWAAMDSIYGLTEPNDTADWSGDTSSFQNHLPGTDTDEFYRLLAEHGVWYTTNYGRQQFLFGWDDVQYFGWDDNRDPWSYESYNSREYYNLYENPDQVRVCYEWDADSFSDWEFPDPTFNDLMPNMTNSELKDLILDLGIEWRKSDCDTTDF